MVNEYDRRQLELMQKQISFFREGSLSLQMLINNIGSLIDALENIESSWIDQCRAFWWELEQVYAVSLDRKKTTLDKDDLKIISAALEGIEKLIKLCLSK